MKQKPIGQGMQIAGHPDSDRGVREDFLEEGTFQQELKNEQEPTK